MRYYLGIDGGGSKTTALLCNEALRPVSSFTGGGTNHHTIGLNAARKNLSAVIDGILQQNNVKLSAVFIGHSSLSGKADADLIREFCGGIVPCDQIGMDSDLYIGLEAMETDGAVALAVCGTGSMAAGRLTDGQVLRTGGWGYILGDEGSGISISLDAIRAAIRGSEGAGQKTMLTECVLSHFNLKELSYLIPYVYDGTFTPDRIASFAPAVFRCAENGDAAAIQVINKNACQFADTVKALLRNMPADAPLGLWGGIFQHFPSYRQAFFSEIKGEFPGTDAWLLPNPPEYGAVLAAMKLDRERNRL